MDSNKRTITLDWSSTLDELSAAVENMRATQALFAESLPDMRRFDTKLEDMRRVGTKLEACYSSVREVQRIVVSQARQDARMNAEIPALRRALTLLLREVPAARELSARKALTLMRGIAHQFQRTHGAQGGARRAAMSQVAVSHYQTTWERARERNPSVGAATARTAQAHGISRGQVRRLRRQARERGTPWRGDDER
jgi:hypothetical protein